MVWAPHGLCSCCPRGWSISLRWSPGGADHALDRGSCPVYRFDRWNWGNRVHRRGVQYHRHERGDPSQGFDNHERGDEYHFDDHQSDLVDHTPWALGCGRYLNDHNDGLEGH
jgi:hypothetical protein